MAQEGRQATSASVLSPSPNWGRRFDQHHGHQPLSASSSSVTAAAALLPERSTLVAPGLPLP
jgi:hypothetical protein